MDTEIIFFTASWCGPCKQMKKILTDDIRKELNIRLADIEEDDEYQMYNVMSVPTFVFYGSCYDLPADREQWL